jgi:hypothetical protein
LQYFTFPDELGHESSDNRSKRSDISERIDASVMILHCLLSLVSINESSHFSSLYFLNATDHQRGGVENTGFSAGGGVENTGFINCCAPQTFLHGFVIK